MTGVHLLIILVLMGINAYVFWPDWVEHAEEEEGQDGSV